MTPSRFLPHSDSRTNLPNPPSTSRPRLSDVIRSSAVFHSLPQINAAVMALIDPNGDVQVVRIKDRVSYPLDSGYRDLLLNLKVVGYDLVMELQLHLKDVIALKEGGHRIYGESLPEAAHPIRVARCIHPT